MMPNRTLAEQIIRADEINLEYFATRTDLPGATLFTAERADAPEFDLALIHRVAPETAGAVLAAIIRHFRIHNRRPSVRLTDCSEPWNWADLLRSAGFVETAERFDYIVLPEVDWPPDDPSLVIDRAVTPDDADRFSAIQVAGFDLEIEHHEWDRVLAQRHLAAGRHHFYLASVGGKPVGSARSIHLPGGFAGLSALATIPEARGHGVGTALLRRMAGDARAEGNTTLFGVVRTESYAARYYERIGWLPIAAARTFCRPT
jgi:GNAT superfamily N-acetyltransferase